MAALALVGCLLLIVTTVPAPGIYGARYRLLVEILVCAAVGTCGALAIMRLPRRAAVALIVVAALAMPLVSFAKKAPLSDDLYRYAWDGRIQAAGIDPYRYTPNDPALDRFHDQSWLWPDPAGCAALHRKAGCTLINRESSHTIYPPFAELYFLALHATGIEAFHDRGLEAAGFLIELAVLAVMLALLQTNGGDGLRAEPRLLAFWVLSPLPVLELVSDGHVDGLALLLALFAFLVLRRGHPQAAAALVSLAALTKLYPALLLFAVLSRDRRTAVRQSAVFLGLFAVGYAPHVAVVGQKVLGYLPGYLQEEQYDKGTRYLLLSIVGIRGHLATALVLVLMVVAIVVIRRASPAPLVAATWLYGVLFLLTTPVQPWYAVSLGGVAVCAGRWEWLAVGIAAYPAYFPALLHGHPDGAGEISYSLALLFIVAVTLGRRRRATGQWPALRRPHRIRPQRGSPARPPLAPMTP